jgi:membrane-bound lytic murein transglycosylase A
MLRVVIHSSRHALFCWRGWALVLTAGLAACASPVPSAVPAPLASDSTVRAPIAPASLPGWDSDDLAGVEGALELQCALTSPPGAWPVLCREFEQQRANLKNWIANRFRAWPLLAADGNPQGLITGYYEPLVEGSRSRENDSQVPIYRKPADMLRVEVTERDTDASTPPQSRGRLAGDRVLPYFTRLEIESALPLAGQELFWIDDAVDAYFLQIQGSGRVKLRDGTIVRVGYADHNGHPYRAIGRVLVDRGALAPDDANAESIKRWLRANRQAGLGVMRENPRFVFFRELAASRADLGPPGSLSVALTPMRSIASDPRVVPPGSLAYLDTSHPSTGGPIQRIVVSQDTGAAITGAVRADLFWGFGEDAERNAGLMRQRGRLWLLWPADSTPPSAAR